MNPNWLYGLGGGLMIGVSAALYLLLNGRIAGISGLFGGMVAGKADGDSFERLAFIAALIGVPAIYVFAGGAPEANAPVSAPLLVAAGLLVGVGTRMGGGCTSGHGVCGMSRVSPRSIIAAVTFMACGAVVVTLGRHVIGGL
ncbi:MAG: YeeE/YedE family protein [Pseudomonadota bacterium]